MQLLTIKICNNDMYNFKRYKEKNELYSNISKTSD